MSRKESAVSNEEIVAAMLEHRTIQEAAAATGLTPRAIYDRMITNEFQAAYTAAKADLVRGAVATLNGRLERAFDTIDTIMQDQTANPATRITAAKIIIETATKFIDRLDTADGNAHTAAENNMWGTIF